MASSQQRDALDARAGRDQTQGIKITRARARLFALLLSAILIALSIAFADRPVALFMNRLDIASPWLEYFIRSERPLVPALGALTLMAAWLAAKGRPLPHWLWISVLAGISLFWALGATEFLLKPLFSRTGPNSLIRDGLYTFFLHHNGHPYRSFPSGHAAVIASVASVYAKAYPRARLALMVLVSMIGIALVVTTDHFISDVIAGAIVGFATGGITFLLLGSRHVPAGTKSAFQ